MSSRIELPPVPSGLEGEAVAAWAEPLVIDSYLPLPPSEHSAFLDGRVYQGSSGRVFPLPFHERVESEKRPHTWQAVHLENQWIRLVILPELGGRIHIGYDKTADYDFFYRNNVIKPALVGLAGPWISGGVEFNWPQHHRPATFLPTDVEIEHEPDGAVTVWCGDHDPFERMKAVHGIRLRPDSNVIEARVRLYNRSPLTQTFLWWANVAARVGEEYQSFFPTDVHWVADHAKRAIATFPAVDGSYYGVDYPARREAGRGDGDRIDWYRNIPVPTSYMITHTDDDFFGGYDHGREAGFVHWADRRIAPGKKQWTWGNAPFGWAWDRNLTDDDGPYVELMAGVYTDNQPDFSFLAPGETKTFSQFWYPIRHIGPAHQANLEVAVSLSVDPASALGPHAAIRFGVSPTRAISARIRLLAGGAVLHEEARELLPGDSVVRELLAPHALEPTDLTLEVSDGDRVVMSWTPRASPDREAKPAAATEPPLPDAIHHGEELVLTGDYLAQYRHATRRPEPYWEAALEHDPGDTRAHIALATARLRQGRFEQAESHARAAITRLTHRVPNPRVGESHYLVGLILLERGELERADDAFAKAAWLAEWFVPSNYQRARLAARQGRGSEAEDLLRGLLARDAEHLQAQDLLATLLLRGGRDREADGLLATRLAVDPLDQWARALAGRPLTQDATILVDIALEFAGVGEVDRALELLDHARIADSAAPIGQRRVAILSDYHRARLLDDRGDAAGARAARTRARSIPLASHQAQSLDDLLALSAAIDREQDPVASLLRGNWHYAHDNYDEAIGDWARALELASDPATTVFAHRNLGIALYNHRHDLAGARTHYEAARVAAPQDALVVREYVELLARSGVSAGDRLALLDSVPELVAQRDDLSITVADLATETGDPDRARRILLGRRFQPWEGGEGLALRSWERSCLELARRALDTSDPDAALAYVAKAIDSPEHLGEARHELASPSELLFEQGRALEAAGRRAEAEDSWRHAAEFPSDFVGMSAQSHSAQTEWSVRALVALGEFDRARAMTEELRVYADRLAAIPGAIDFFATSLPTMLIFHDSPQLIHDGEVAELRGVVDRLQSWLGEFAPSAGVLARDA